MGPVDFIVIGVVLLIVGLVTWYLIRQKKRGVKCIGCPSASSCAEGSKQGKSAEGCSSCSGSCASCGSCNKGE